MRFVRLLYLDASMAETIWNWRGKIPFSVENQPRRIRDAPAEDPP